MIKVSIIKRTISYGDESSEAMAVTHYGYKVVCDKHINPSCISSVDVGSMPIHTSTVYYAEEPRDAEDSYFDEIKTLSIKMSNGDEFLCLLDDNTLPLVGVV